MTEVEGGLDEPAELEPEQGSLDLASPEDAHGRAEWEKAAAAVLRKAGRLAADDPDDGRVGQARPDHAGRPRRPSARHRRAARRAGHRRSPDACGRLGHPRPPRHQSTPRRPTRPRWSTSPTAQRPCGSRSSRLPTSTRSSRACSWTSRRSCWTCRPTRWRPRRASSPTPVTPISPTAPTWAPTRSVRRCAVVSRQAPARLLNHRPGPGRRAGAGCRDPCDRRGRHGGARPGCVRRAGARLLDGRGRGVPPDPHRRRHPARRRGRR